MRTGVVSLWAVGSIHHAYGAGRFDTPLRLLEVALVTVVMAVTLALLRRYERTGGQRAYTLFTAVTLVYWVFLSGLFHGFYGHVLKVVSFFFFDSSLPRFAEGMGDGPPTDLFFEATGVLCFLLGIWIVVAWRRLAGARRSANAGHGREADVGAHA